MAVIEEKVTTYSCDAPECGKQERVVEGEHPRGFLGSYSWLGKEGVAAGVSFFACRETHVGKAVKATLAEYAAAVEDQAEGDVRTEQEQERELREDENETTARDSKYYGS